MANVGSILFSPRAQTSLHLPGENSNHYANRYSGMMILLSPSCWSFGWNNKHTLGQGGKTICEEGFVANGEQTCTSECATTPVCRSVVTLGPGFPGAALGFLHFPFPGKNRVVPILVFSIPLQPLVFVTFIRDRQSGMDGSVRFSHLTRLADRVMETHRFTHSFFNKVGMKAQIFHWWGEDPLGIYQCAGKKEAEVAFSFSICYEVGWMWMSNSTRLRVAQGMAKDQGLTFLYPLLFEEAVLDDSAFSALIFTFLDLF